MTLVKVIFVK